MAEVYARAMASWEAKVLAGSIVRLEPLARRHADGLWEASRDARTWRWLNVSQPRDRAAFDLLLEAALAARRRGSEIPFATVDAATGRVVGSTRYLALRPEHGSAEIGWTWLHPSAWGTGANVEAKLLMLDHAFAVFGCRRVEFKTDALNERARGALEALGAAFEGVHRQHMLVRQGENRDSAWYAILDGEWPETRRLLEERLRGLRRVDGWQRTR